MRSSGCGPAASTREGRPTSGKGISSSPTAPSPLGAAIEKWRHFVPHAGHVWDIDVFEGANQGLVVAEIELDDVAESFEKPPWIGAEVSDDPRYYNVCLVEHPYCDWEK